jgi:hypothetical protein
MVTPIINSGYAIDFGAVRVGQERAGVIALLDTGCPPLQVISVGPPTDGEFSPLSLSPGETIQPAGQIDFGVSFAPASVGNKAGEIVVQTDSESTPTITLTFTGIGVAPDGG